MTDLRIETEIQLSLPLEPKPETDWRAQVPSVSQLTRRIRGHVENAFFDTWVRGEISNFRKPASGHVYFILKDATCQLRAVMFRNSLSKIKFQVKDGMEILLHGPITVYEARGEYQMVADTMEPVGVGALQLAFEQLKQKLHAEGLFDPKFKKKLPFLPKRIGIVTSQTGAAVKDCLKVLSRRFPNLHVVILPCAVQGEKAAGEIVQALSFAEKWNQEQPDRKLEALIVGRGGGSMEDLWCFNEEAVARAIFKCSIPIISAVGHEIDFTIADFVADLRAPTPSAAAEIIIPKREDLENLVENQTSRLKMIMKKRLEQLRLHLGHLGQRLIDPRQKVKKIQENFQNLTQRMILTMKHRILMARRKWEHGTQLLHSLSPLQVISRGYSITQKEDGSILRNVTQAPAGTRLTTRVADGVLVSEVLPENALKR
jgi:exodeoxyribonuclease VII large subunit